MPITIRPFTEKDFDELLDLANAAVPFAPEENAEWLAYRRAFDETRQIRRHFLAEDERGRAVGYSCLEQQGDDPTALRVFVVCSPHRLIRALGTQLFEHLLGQAQTLQATILWAREYQQDDAARTFFLQHGFVITHEFTLPGERPMIVYQRSLA
ncbi:MAG: GNAT family N-acetyltransferase [Candidatus Promineifilaceae bacterium]|nr:GNAT family N-acetyltransferase [Candidatus Promineifilaceae bacterium]